MKVSCIVLFPSQVIIYRSAVAIFSSTIFTLIYDARFRIKSILWSEIAKSLPKIIVRKTPIGKFHEVHVDAVHFEAKLIISYQNNNNKKNPQKNKKPNPTQTFFFFFFWLLSM